MISAQEHQNEYDKLQTAGERVLCPSSTTGAKCVVVSAGFGWVDGDMRLLRHDASFRALPGRS